MKIVHLIWSFNTGGAETMLIDIINEQMKYEDISLFVVNRVYRKELLAKGDILGYINCDDIYLPNAISKVVKFLTTIQT